MITAAVRAQLNSYLGELLRFNQRINLTAVAEEEAWQRHIEESVRLLEVLTPAAHARVVDVGSGAGVPGIPVAVLRNDLHLTLLDSDARRCGFLLHVCGVLRLDNVTVVHARAETYGRDPQARASFDVAVSRATAPPPVFCELALPLLRDGGVAGWLVGDAAAAVALCAYAAHACGGAMPQAVGPDIVTVLKERATPDTYPRRSGVPSRRPLLAPGSGAATADR